jgi:hypothetical protein
VWGHGGAGYGPFRVRRLLGDRDVGAKLDAAVTVLREDGAVGAYAAMLTGDARTAGLGPARVFVARRTAAVGATRDRRSAQQGSSRETWSASFATSDSATRGARSRAPARCVRKLRR